MTGPHSNSTQQLHASSATSMGKHMGMTAYHNFVADPELGEKVAARQIPCVCVISDNGVDDGLLG